MTKPRGRPRHPDILTPAEWRVLEHVQRGRSNPEIATELQLSVNTVRYHVSNILAKLELRDRAALKDWDGRPARRQRWAWQPALLFNIKTWSVAVAGIVAITAAIVVSIPRAETSRTVPSATAIAVAPLLAEPTTTSTQPTPPTATAVPRSVQLLERAGPQLVRMCAVHDDHVWRPLRAMPPGIGSSTHILGMQHRVSEDGCIRTLPAVEMAEQLGSVPLDRQDDVMVACWLWPLQVEVPDDALAVTVEPLRATHEPDNTALHRIVGPTEDQLVFANCGVSIAVVNRFDNASVDRWLPAE